MMENSSFEPKLLQKSILGLEKKLLLLQETVSPGAQRKAEKKGLLSALMRWINFKS